VGRRQGECGPDYVSGARHKSVYGLPRPPNCAQKELKAAFVRSAAIFVPQSATTARMWPPNATITSYHRRALRLRQWDSCVDEHSAVGDAEGLAKQRAAPRKVERKISLKKKSTLSSHRVEIARDRGKKWGQVADRPYHQTAREVPLSTALTLMDPGTAKAFMILARAY
jgi:hypothetical protein